MVVGRVLSLAAGCITEPCAGSDRDSADAPGCLRSVMRCNYFVETSSTGLTTAFADTAGQMSARLSARLSSQLSHASSGTKLAKLNFGHWASTETPATDATPALAVEDGGTQASGSGFPHALHIAAAAGDLAELRRLLDGGVPVEETNTRGITALMVAATGVADNAEAMLRELLKRSAEVNARDHMGWSSLHHACRNGCEPAVEVLIKADADLLLTTPDGKNPIMLAAIQGSVPTLHLLLQREEAAELRDAKDIYGATPLHYAVKGCCGLSTPDAVEQAAAATQCLCNHFVKINARDRAGETPLVWAVRHGVRPCVKTLFKNRADMNLPDIKKRNPLYHALDSGHETLACYLLSKRAKLNTKSSEGLSPLELAENFIYPKFNKAVGFFADGDTETKSDKIGRK